MTHYTCPTQPSAAVGSFCALYNQWNQQQLTVAWWLDGYHQRFGSEHLGVTNWEWQTAPGNFRVTIWKWQSAPGNLGVTIWRWLRTAPGNLGVTFRWWLRTAPAPQQESYTTHSRADSKAMTCPALADKQLTHSLRWGTATTYQLWWSWNSSSTSFLVWYKERGTTASTFTLSKFNASNTSNGNNLFSPPCSV